MVSKRNLVWVSRDGKEEPIEAAPKTYSLPKISPDGRMIGLTDETSGNSDIWIWDLFRKTMTRLTFDEGEDSYPVWSPDGKRFLMVKEYTGDAAAKEVARPKITIVLNWAFAGGTALRFLSSIPRFSEDLDFSRITPGKDIDFKPAAAETKRVFEREGYSIEIKASEKGTVSSAWVRFPGLPREVGISSHAFRALSVRVELDTNPPAGAQIENSIVRRHVTLNLCHYDKASLLTGKINAVLTRSWTKGRNLYDLVWYLAEHTWPAPNLILLNAALEQMGWKGPRLTKTNWKKQLRNRIASLDWERARADVNPFLEHEHDLDLVKKDVLIGLLK